MSSRFRSTIFIHDADHSAIKILNFNNHNTFFKQVMDHTQDLKTFKIYPQRVNTEEMKLTKSGNPVISKRQQAILDHTIRHSRSEEDTIMLNSKFIDVVSSHKRITGIPKDTGEHEKHDFYFDGEGQMIIMELPGDGYDSGQYGKLKIQQINDKEKTESFAFQFACRSEQSYLFCFLAKQTYVFVKYSYREIITKSIDGTPLIENDTNLILIRRAFQDQDKVKLSEMTVSVFLNYSKFFFQKVYGGITLKF